MRGISIEQADICEAPALNPLADKPVILGGAFNAQIAKLRIRTGDSDQETTFTASNLAYNRVGIAENLRPRKCLFKLAYIDFNSHTRIQGTF